MVTTKTLSFRWMTGLCWLGMLVTPTLALGQEQVPQLPPGTKQLLNSISTTLTPPPQSLMPKKASIKRGIFKEERPKVAGAPEEMPTGPSPAEIAAQALPGMALPDGIGKATMDISVHKKAKPDIVTDRTLEKGYRALLAGQNEVAVSLYKQIAQIHPDNANALFGLATAYQRNGQVEQARAAYTQLLTRYPRHREGLNNFLALAADEAPQEALAEFKKLERANPEFSPVIAQIAMLYAKQGGNEQAIRYFNRAIALSPENTVYRYNLAILLDRLGHYPEAAKLYRQVMLLADKNNVALPAPEAVIQERLEFVSAQ